MSGVKNRLIKYINVAGVRVAEFERSIGVSSGYVKNISKSIQPDILENISNNYPDLNIEWLLINKGDMLRESSDSENYKEKYLQVMEEQNELNKKYTALLEEMRGRDNEKNTSAGMDSAATDAPGKTGS